ncbi:glutathione S-transferase N-terminal domain-containing protein [Albidovulum sp.]|uniref:glutathione S-transferase N-terminal domain-containing protein n=1 Tax=Albidovulum sp. TaxID=1872424 RepID=UPI001D8518CF|nr:glutathione S-transferase [Paracoccaceae bacterium]HPE24613.1 glutathione S-transferase [Albidovulum sp.]MCB2140004.1 glutathione S-transferase [Paracoccaceae bacterium]MCB2144429.1 glutathione S-transferase [Paracoccaceae bacterium]MCP5356051.1 glutathione S-transferase [Paracoccaceae bacterium]
MTYELAIGDRSYSSWSLRGWLFFEKFGIPVKIRTCVLYTDEVQRLLADFAPARLVPAVRTPEGEVIGESIAILETLAERHPGAGLWPEDAAARIMARYMVAEMHAGFGALRGDCAMNLLKSYVDSAPSDAVLADLARIDLIWARARDRFGTDGPWLFGRYTAADAFFAPVATRIATYNLPVSAVARAYVAAHLADPSFRRWRAMGQAENLVQPSYYKPFAERPWPGPAPLPAEIAEGPSVNAACPYSGKPVTHFLRLDGRVWGFCNAFCRDKTLHDPEAWPKFMELLRSA